MKRIAMSAVNNWIQQTVKDKKFADLGGLWGLVNEKVSVAHKAGASECSMWDQMCPEHGCWLEYRDRLINLGIPTQKEKTFDIMDSQHVKGTSPVNVLHCSGVIYHIPNYFEFMVNIEKMTTEYLILGSTTIPDHFGMLPQWGLSDFQRSELKRHFQHLGQLTPGLLSVVQPSPICEDVKNYTPWWWFFTKEYLYNLLVDFGWNVLDCQETWEDRAHSFLCVKRSLKTTTVGGI